MLRVPAIPYAWTRAAMCFHWVYRHSDLHFPFPIEGLEPFATQIVEFNEYRIVVGMDGMILTWTAPVRLLFPNHAMMIGGRQWSWTTLPSLKRRESNRGGWQLVGISLSAKILQAKGPTADTTGAGAAANREAVLLEEASSAFLCMLLNKASSSVQVLNTAMHPICSVNDVDFRNLVHQHKDVEGEVINSFVYSVHADPAYSVWGSQRDPNAAHESLREAGMVSLVTMCRIVTCGGAHSCIVCRTLQCGDWCNLLQI